MSILNNTIRNGNFTSSNIVELTKVDKNGEFKAAAMTYITECNYERMLGGCIDTEFDAKPTLWGQLMEKMAFADIGLEYVHCSDITKQHPTISYLVGSTDGIKEVEERTCFDFKSPYTKKSFIGLVLPLYCGLSGFEAMTAIRKGFSYNGYNYPEHKDGEKFYWQGVSNCLINNCNWFELIVYMPYQSDLIKIDGIVLDDPRYNFIKYNPEQVPCLPDGGTFKNINIIRFEVPQSDKDFLTSQVEKAGKLLISRP